LPFLLSPLHVGFGELAAITDALPADVVASFKNLSVFNDKSLRRLKESNFDRNLEALRKFPNWEKVVVMNLNREIESQRTQELRRRMEIYAGAAERFETSES